MHEPTKELAALKYALTKETRLVLNTISGELTRITHPRILQK